MNLITRFWYDWITSSETKTTENMVYAIKLTAERLAESEEVPYLFPQYLATKENYKACLDYADYFEYLIKRCTMTLPAIECPLIIPPDEFRKYINMTIIDFRADKPNFRGAV